MAFSLALYLALPFIQMTCTPLVFSGVGMRTWEWRIDTAVVVTMMEEKQNAFGCRQEKNKLSQQTQFHFGHEETNYTMCASESVSECVCVCVSVHACACTSACNHTCACECVCTYMPIHMPVLSMCSRKKETEMGQSHQNQHKYVYSQQSQ